MDQVMKLENQYSHRIKHIQTNLGVTYLRAIKLLAGIEQTRGYLPISEMTLPAMVQAARSIQEMLLANQSQLMFDGKLHDA